MERQRLPEVSVFLFDLLHGQQVSLACHYHKVLIKISNIIHTYYKLYTNERQRYSDYLLQKCETLSLCKSSKICDRLLDTSKIYICMFKLHKQNNRSLTHSYCTLRVRTFFWLSTRSGGQASYEMIRETSNSSTRLASCNVAVWLDNK